ncbi:MAG: nucleotidyl transferase AbiEii/AbiGii toxin family protein [Spirochaetales bacterium]|jgi:predicted nucleotidyltransferase component of viral defense system|nr:nucleotidyl transferase AbiEii/AbiGii toxin family protein [Spirochaetales bacterium]
MSIRMIEQKLKSYSVSSEIEEMQALREITQEVILASLGRTGFFNQAAFQGGTCLRIFHGLNRFSENLDFTLLDPNPEFAWQDYLGQVASDVASFGYQMEVTDRHETESTVRFAFLKDEAVGKILQLRYAGKTMMLGKIRIKLEIDTNPPAGGQNEVKYMDFPYLSPITVQNPATLFAGKIPALLCRNYVIGRDWYDFLWYTARKTPVNYRYLEEALHQCGPWKVAVKVGYTVKPDGREKK